MYTPRALALARACCARSAPAPIVGKEARTSPAGDGCAPAAAVDAGAGSALHAEMRRQCDCAGALASCGIPAPCCRGFATIECGERCATDACLDALPPSPSSSGPRSLGGTSEAWRSSIVLDATALAIAYFGDGASDPGATRMSRLACTACISDVARLSAQNIGPAHAVLAHGLGVARVVARAAAFWLEANGSRGLRGFSAAGMEIVAPPVPPPMPPSAPPLPPLAAADVPAVASVATCATALEPSQTVGGRGSDGAGPAVDGAKPGAQRRASRDGAPFSVAGSAPTVSQADAGAPHAELGRIETPGKSATELPTAAASGTPLSPPPPPPPPPLLLHSSHDEPGKESAPASADDAALAAAQTAMRASNRSGRAIASGRGGGAGGARWALSALAHAAQTRAASAAGWGSSVLGTRLIGAWKVAADAFDAVTVDHLAELGAAAEATSTPVAASASATRAEPAGATNEGADAARSPGEEVGGRAGERDDRPGEAPPGRPRSTDAVSGAEPAGPGPVVASALESREKGTDRAQETVRPGADATDALGDQLERAHNLVNPKRPTAPAPRRAPDPAPPFPLADRVFPLGMLAFAVASCECAAADVRAIALPLRSVADRRDAGRGNARGGAPPPLSTSRPASSARRVPTDALDAASAAAWTEASDGDGGSGTASAPARDGATAADLLDSALSRRMRSAAPVACAMGTDCAAGNDAGDPLAASCSGAARGDATGAAEATAAVDGGPSRATSATIAAASRAVCRGQAVGRLPDDDARNRQSAPAGQARAQHPPRPRPDAGRRRPEDSSALASAVARAAEAAVDSAAIACAAFAYWSSWCGDGSASSAAAAVDQPWIAFFVAALRAVARAACDVERDAFLVGVFSDAPTAASDEIRRRARSMPSKRSAEWLISTYDGAVKAQQSL